MKPFLIPYSLIFYCFTILFSSCSYSTLSNKSRAEEITVDFKEDPLFAEQAIEKQTVLSRGEKTRGLITASMLLQATSLGTKLVKKVIDNEKKKYTAEYVTGLNNLYFYDKLSEQGVWDPDGMQLREFSLIRTFYNKKSKQIDTALKIIFEIDTSNMAEVYNNSIFKLKIKQIDINYAKAKVPTSKWYLPWTNFQKKHNNKLNLDVEISFFCNYTQSDGNMYKDINLGTFYYFLRDAPLVNKDSFYTNEQGKLLDGYSFLVPRSSGHYYNGKTYEEVYSQGAYSFVIKIKESGKSKFVDQLLMNNSSTIIDAINGELEKKIK